jgi:hypothetical protein
VGQAPATTVVQMVAQTAALTAALTAARVATGRPTVAQAPAMTVVQMVAQTAALTAVPDPTAVPMVVLTAERAADRHRSRRTPGGPAGPPGPGATDRDLVGPLRGGGLGNCTAAREEQ